MKVKTVEALFAKLENHPDVVGLVGYGTDHRGDDHAVGDLDLFVILSVDKLPIESLHFDVGKTPVDLNLLTFDVLRALEPAFAFPQLPLAEGRVIYDATGAVGHALERLSVALRTRLPEPLTEGAVTFLRHGHRHLLDKLKGRLETEPLLAQVLLNTAPYWLMENYFRVRQVPFRGERWALAYWREHEPGIYRTLEALYQEADLAAKVALTEALTELVLAPVGGPWQRGEVLGFGEDSGRSLSELSQATYRYLLERAAAH